jgi:uncharacterized protein YndB with AHSA1/START domain
MTSASRPAGALSGQTIVIERTYRARAEELWELWTTKEGFESWWGPEGFRVEVHTLEPRVGGTLSYDMIADTPEMIAAMKRMGREPSHATHARFVELTPLKRLVITHVIDFLPGVRPYESTIMIEFFSSGDSVRMIITLQPMHSDDFTRMSLRGWTSQLAKLDERFGGQQP